MALPGGRRDPGDHSLLHTVQRETQEEVGVSLQEGRLLGHLDDIVAVARGKRTGMVVRPYVFEWTQDQQVTLDTTEVAEALWAPLGPMMTGQLDAIRPYEYEGRAMSLPAFDVDGRLVWGLTYHILRSVFDLVERGR